jgi:hypothetical protein
LVDLGVDEKLKLKCIYFEEREWGHEWIKLAQDRV